MNRLEEPPSPVLVPTPWGELTVASTWEFSTSRGGRYRCVSTSTMERPDGVPETWLPPVVAALNVEVDGAGSSVRLVVPAVAL